MMSKESKFLNDRQIQTINRIGDLWIPGDGELPSFEKVGGVKEVDRILSYMPASDLGDLKLLLNILSFFPKFILELLLKLVEKAPALPSPVGALLRQVRLGLRGLVMSLYFSEDEPLRVLGYEVQVYTKDQ
jgi:hypothetical protein